MKKIVALVLCLALALSLCTVAFAKTAKIDSDTTARVLDDEAAKAPTVKNKAVTKPGNVAYYEYNGVYYVTADTTATNTLKIGDTSVRVQNKGSELGVLQYQYVATKITDINNGTCGSMKDDAETMTFVTWTTAAGDVKLGYTDDASTTWRNNVLLNGAVKSVTEITVDNADTYYTKHDWELVDADDDNAVDAAELVKCSECGATSKIYNDNTAPVSGTIFELLSLTETSTDDTLYAAATYKWMGASAAADKSETVESAKTFDAGIALYAGMALASVAGSAVVIGKKKEF